MLHFSALPVASSKARQLALAGFALLAPLAASAQTITSFSPTYGTVGSSLTITGTSLTTATAVQINGETMRITATNAVAGTITVKVPASASTGLLRVTTGTGTVLSDKGFRVTRQSTSFSYPASGTATGAGNLGDYSTPTIADLDDDGLLDMIVGYGDGANNTNGGTLRRFEQTSLTDGTFGSSATTTPRTLTVGAAASGATNPAITVANYAKPWLTDLDGDGLLDMLVGETGGTIRLYEQNSTLYPNNFGPPITLFANPDATTPANRYYARPTVVDLDNDGLLDILVGANDGFIRRYEQKVAGANTTANFNDLGTLKTSGGLAIDGGDVSKAQVLDIDGDGLLDLLIGNAAGNVLQYVQSSVGAATFDRVGTGSFNGIALGAGQYAAPLMADVDNDGLMDLLLGNFNLASGDIQRYEQSASTATPLPVVLTSFTGQLATAGATLRWVTASELHSAAFVVERSADGRTFADISTLTAAGTTNAAHAYSYLDATANTQTSTTLYYRLRQVDQDGTTAYSPVVTLTRTTASAASTRSQTASAYPNPFTESLYVVLPAGSEPQAAHLELATLTGQVLYAGQLQLSAVPQQLTNLPALTPGLYIVRLTTASGTTMQRVSRR
ncbi:FG-GAP-like repeat-containing protein [Hymenobacter lucidus]|uniref:FG-GAP-like repeat-containing protein n=1 Tax=Hymenobacter lucidus TaxID=2880930 RepID=A0ABS8AQE9_9BACT|nr:FG-GAP-like repeat-containing protein [Hymenobacter lucidus]MCB2407619.1 FG-GAP-like repeat-containing protein [Hymenobacter lucidus]